VRVPVIRTEQPRTPAAAQAALPLFDPPADKPKEAFVWDESKGLSDEERVYGDLFGTDSVARPGLPRTQHKFIALQIFEYGRCAPGFLLRVLEELNAALF
jgi:hypothetical protein